MTKKYHVYCATEKDRCGLEACIGIAEFNQGVRCPRCGRYTKPGTFRKKNFTFKRGPRWEEKQKGII